MGNKHSSRTEVPVITRTQFFPPNSTLQDQIRFLWATRLWRFGLNVRREIVSYLFSEDFLVRVDDYGLAIFRPLSRTWSYPLSLSQQIYHTKYTVYALIDESTVFGYGFGGKCLNKPVIFHLTTQVVDIDELPEMHQVRNNPGVLAYRGTIYVFGGIMYSRGTSYKGDSQTEKRSDAANSLNSRKDADFADSNTPILRTCEAFSLNPDSEWTWLPNMQHGRYKFNPIQYKGCIYLPSDSLASVVEVFDSRTHSFAPSIPLHVPAKSSQDGDILVIGQNCFPSALCYLYTDSFWDPQGQLVSACGDMYYLDTSNDIHQLKIVGNKLINRTRFDRNIEGCPKIWCLTADTLWQYDPISEFFFEGKEIKFEHDSNCNMSFTRVNDTTLFCCSDQLQEGMKQAFLLHINETVEVEYLPPLLQDRYFAGLIAYAEVLYAFGGSARGNTLASCESFSSVWVNLPPMREGRIHFMPCVHEDCFYLAGGNSHYIEVFNVRAAAFTQCIALPIRLTAVALVERNKLIAFNRSSRMELDLARLDAAPQFSPRQHSDNVNPAPQSHPISYRNCWYFCSFKSDSKDMSKCTISKIQID